MKKLTYQVKRELESALCEFQVFDRRMRTDHFQISFNKGSTDGKAVNNHGRSKEEANLGNEKGETKLPLQ